MCFASAPNDQRRRYEHVLFSLDSRRRPQRIKRFCFSDRITVRETRRRCLTGFSAWIGRFRAGMHGRAFVEKFSSAHSVMHVCRNGGNLVIDQ